MKLTAIMMDRVNGELKTWGVPVEGSSKTDAIKKAKAYAKANNWRYFGYQEVA